MTDRLATEIDLVTFPADHKGKMTIMDLQVASCRIATDHGFWKDYNTAYITRDDVNYAQYIIETKLMLAVGELSEAEDALRHNKPLPEFAEELADAIIRIADLAHKLGINLEAAIAAKQAYNETRPHLHAKRF